MTVSRPRGPHGFLTDIPMQTPALPGHPTANEEPRSRGGHAQHPQETTSCSREGLPPEKARSLHSPCLAAPAAPSPEPPLSPGSRGVRVVGTAGCPPWESRPVGLTFHPGDSLTLQRAASSPLGVGPRPPPAVTMSLWSSGHTIWPSVKLDLPDGALGTAYPTASSGVGQRPARGSWEPPPPPASV